MKITDVLFVPGDGAFYCDDQQAIRRGAVREGFVYTGAPVTAGFHRVRQPAEALSVLLVLEDGQVAHGDCVGVTYGGVAGREPPFRAAPHVAVAKGVIEPWLAGRRVTTFRDMAGELAYLRDRNEPGPLGSALRYGVSQALLHAVAIMHGTTIAEVVAAEYGLSPSWQPVRIFCQSGEHDRESVDKMLLRGVDVLPHGLINHAARKVGPRGQILLDYVQWVVRRIKTLRPELEPTLHFDVYGTLGEVFGYHDPGALTEYLARVKEVAAPFPLQIEGAIDAGDTEAQLEAYLRLAETKDRLGLDVKLVADEWCNTLEDVQRYIDRRAVDMIQVKMPDVGSVDQSIEAILACRRAGMPSYLGGSCAETERSAQIGTQIALALEPDQMLAKPGLDVDAAITIVRNEMARTIALVQRRAGRDSIT